MNLINDQYEKEITLIDCFRFIWKWKGFIIIMSLAWIIAVSIYLSNTEVSKNKYRVKTVVEPGLKGIDENGKYLYLDSPAQIKEIIDGEIRYVLPEKMNERGIQKVSKKQEIITSLSDYSNRLDIQVVTSSKEEGVSILNLMLELLQKKYSDIVTNLKEVIDKKIEFELLQKNSLQEKIKLCHNNIDRLKETVRSLQAKMDQINELGFGPDVPKSINKKNTEFEFNDVYEADVLMRKYQLENLYFNQINAAISTMESAKSNLADDTANLQNISTLIRNLENEKAFIKNIKVVIPPVANFESPFKIIKRHLPLVTLFGIFFSIVLSILMEYVRKNR